jgi:hypothetical protein
MSTSRFSSRALVAAAHRATSTAAPTAVARSGPEHPVGTGIEPGATDSSQGAGSPASVWGGAQAQDLAADALRLDAEVEQMRAARPSLTRMSASRICAVPT